MVVIIILFIFGLIFGSFLNVVIFRYDPNRSVFYLGNKQGRSRCPHCKKELGWFELIPLFSFVFQFGKCRSCGERISWQYPVVELLSGLVFAGIPIFVVDFFAMHAPEASDFLVYSLAAAWVFIFITWLLISFIDKKWLIVPDELNIALGLTGIMIVFLKFFAMGPVFESSVSFLIFETPFFIENLFLNHLFAAVLGAGFFLIFILGSGGRAMGWGDAKLAFAGGLILGWPDIALGLMLGFIVGGIFGSFVLILGRKRFGDKIPFAPFLVLGMALAVLFGADIVDWYLGVIGF